MQPARHHCPEQESARAVLCARLLGCQCTQLRVRQRHRWRTQRWRHPHDLHLPGPEVLAQHSALRHPNVLCQQQCKRTDAAGGDQHGPGTWRASLHGIPAVLLQPHAHQSTICHIRAAPSWVAPLVLVVCNLQPANIILRRQRGGAGACHACCLACKGSNPWHHSCAFQVPSWKVRARGAGQAHPADCCCRAAAPGPGVC